MGRKRGMLMPRKPGTERQKVSPCGTLCCNFQIQRIASRAWEHDLLSSTVKQLHVAPSGDHRSAMYKRSRKGREGQISNIGHGTLRRKATKTCSQNVESHSQETRQHIGEYLIGSWSLHSQNKNTELMGISCSYFYLRPPSNPNAKTINSANKKPKPPSLSFAQNSI